MLHKKNILLVDDHSIIRDAMKLYFQDHTKYNISAEAESGEEALNLLKNQSFDIIITDISMPNMDGITLCKKIKEIQPSQKILILSMFNESSYIKQVLSLGVNGYMLKTSRKDEIFKALDTIDNGQNYVSEKVTQTIIESLKHRKKPTKRLTVEAPLTSREREILSLIVKEYSNHEIAEVLFISVRTVDAHKRNLLDKTGCKNIAGLVIYAVEHGIS